MFKHEIELIKGIILDIIHENFRTIKDISIIRRSLIGRIGEDNWMKFNLICEEILTPFRLKKLPKDFSIEETRKKLLELIKVLDGGIK